MFPCHNTPDSSEWITISITYIFPAFRTRNTETITDAYHLSFSSQSIFCAQLALFPSRWGPGGHASWDVATWSLIRVGHVPLTTLCKVYRCLQNCSLKWHYTRKKCSSTLVLWTQTHLRWTDRYWFWVRVHKRDCFCEKRCNFLSAESEKDGPDCCHWNE